MLDKVIIIGAGVFASFRRAVYYCRMTTKALARAIKRRKPAIIRQNGAPRYVVLDWDTYRKWEDLREDIEDAERLAAALADPKNQKRIPFSQVKKILRLP